MNRRVSIYITWKSLPCYLIDSFYDRTFLYGNQVDSAISDEKYDSLIDWSSLFSSSLTMYKKHVQAYKT